MSLVALIPPFETWMSLRTTRPHCPPELEIGVVAVRYCTA